MKDRLRALSRDLGILQRNVRAAALVAHCVGNGLCAEGADEVLEDRGVLGVIHLHDLTGTQEEAAVVRGDPLPRQRILDCRLDGVEADGITVLLILQALLI